jgi:hypothetical protein
VYKPWDFCLAHQRGEDHFGKAPFDNNLFILQVPEVKVNAKALLPSSSVIGFTLGQGLSFITFVNTVPISATRTINRFALIRRLDVDKVGKFVFNMPAWDSVARNAMIKYPPPPPLFYCTI